MKLLKNTFIGIAGIVACVPGILYFKSSGFVPELSGLKEMMLLVAEVLCFLIVGLSLILKRNIRSLASNKFMLIIASLFVATLLLLFTYIELKETVVVKGDRKEHVLIMPLVHSGALKAHIEKHGGLKSWLRNEGVFSIERFLLKDSESLKYILFSKILLVSAYCLSIMLILTAILLVTHRIDENSSGINI